MNFSGRRNYTVHGSVFHDAMRFERVEAIKDKHVLPPGRYFVGICIDREDKLKKNHGYDPGKSELCGQVETNDKSKPGCQLPKVVQVPAKD